MVYAYPLQVVMAQMNLFDSHDTDRFASMFVNPDLSYDASNRIEDNNPNYKPDKPTAQQYTRMEQAAAFQMSFIGAPMIYYGDETGMFGPDDPSNRQPMVWKDLGTYDNPQVKFDDDVFNAYQRAIAARNMLPVLRTGFFHGIAMEDSEGVYAFARDLKDDHAYVVVNRSAHSRKVRLPIDSKTPLIDWLSPAQMDVRLPDQSAADARPTLVVKKDVKPLASDHGTLTIELPPYGTAVLTEAK